MLMGIELDIIYYTFIFTLDCVYHLVYKIAKFGFASMIKKTHILKEKNH